MSRVVKVAEDSRIEWYDGEPLEIYFRVEYDKALVFPIEITDEYEEAAYDLFISATNNTSLLPAALMRFMKMSKNRNGESRDYLRSLLGTVCFRNDIDSSMHALLSELILTCIKELMIAGKEI